MKKEKQEVSDELEAEKKRGEEKESDIVELESYVKSKIFNVNRVTLSLFQRWRRSPQVWGRK